MVSLIHPGGGSRFVSSRKGDEGLSCGRGVSSVIHGEDQSFS